MAPSRPARPRPRGSRLVGGDSGTGDRRGRRGLPAPRSELDPVRHQRRRGDLRLGGPADPGGGADRALLATRGGAARRCPLPGGRLDLGVRKHDLRHPARSGSRGNPDRRRALRLWPSTLRRRHGPPRCRPARRLQLAHRHLSIGNPARRLAARGAADGRRALRGATRPQAGGDSIGLVALVGRNGRLRCTGRLRLRRQQRLPRRSRALPRRRRNRTPPRASSPSGGGRRNGGRLRRRRCTDDPLCRRAPGQLPGPRAVQHDLPPAAVEVTPWSRGEGVVPGQALRRVLGPPVLRPQGRHRRNRAGAAGTRPVPGAGRVRNAARALEAPRAAGSPGDHVGSLDAGRLRSFGRGRGQAGFRDASLPGLVRRVRSGGARPRSRAAPAIAPRAGRRCARGAPRRARVSEPRRLLRQATRLRGRALLSSRGQ